ncbi:MAG: orotate phosphoribosyltransferase [Chthoniobacteraceae bacterium]
MSEEYLQLFRETHALLDGHFLLRSGLHSRQFFQCAILLQHTKIAERVCGGLAEKLRDIECESVISPALGGIIVGQEVGRALGKRHIFAEKEEGKLVMRRGFQIAPGERFLVIEDVVTRGGRVQETIDIVRGLGGVVAAVGVIVDRSGGNRPDFGCPFVSLVELQCRNLRAGQSAARSCRDESDQAGEQVGGNHSCKRAGSGKLPALFCFLSDGSGGP